MSLLRFPLLTIPAVLEPQVPVVFRFDDLSKQPSEAAGELFDTDEDHEPPLSKEGLRHATAFFMAHGCLPDDEWQLIHGNLRGDKKLIKYWRTGEERSKGLMTSWRDTFRSRLHGDGSFFLTWVTGEVFAYNLQALVTNLELKAQFYSLAAGETETDAEYDARDTEVRTARANLRNLMDRYRTTYENKIRDVKERSTRSKQGASAGMRVVDTRAIEAYQFWRDNPPTPKVPRNLQTRLDVLRFVRYPHTHMSERATYEFWMQKFDKNVFANIFQDFSHDIDLRTVWEQEIFVQDWFYKLTFAAVDFWALVIHPDSLAYHHATYKSPSLRVNTAKNLKHNGRAVAVAYLEKAEELKSLGRATSEDGRLLYTEWQQVPVFVDPQSGSRKKDRESFDDEEVVHIRKKAKR